MPIDDFATGGFAKEEDRVRAPVSGRANRRKKAEAPKPIPIAVPAKAAEQTPEPEPVPSTADGDKHVLIDILPPSLPKLTPEIRPPSASLSQPEAPVESSAFASPPTPYNYGQYQMSSSPRGGQHMRSTSENYGVAGSPPYAQQTWLNASPSYRAATLAGSPPNAHMTGDSPPSYAPRPYSRPMSGNFQHGFRPPSQYEHAPPAQPPLCFLDSMNILDSDASPQQSAVLLLAKEPSLEIYRVKNERLEIVGSLKDIDGQILDAKVLPTAGRDDLLYHLRPLVAIVIHTSREAPPFSDSTRPTSRASQSREHEPLSFRSRVEIHSLRTGKYVGFLYESPPVQQEPPSWPLGPTAPLPTGDLQIEARGKFIVVASGTSGEVFCFTASDNHETGVEKFRCIAKYWTSVKRKTSSDPAQQQPAGTPIFSLGPRWLCIVPPTGRSKPTISGRVPLASPDARPYGVESVNAPVAPSVDSELDVPNPEGFANKVARGVAQEVFKGAMWVGSQGVSAWNNYFNKPQTSSESPPGQPTPRQQDLMFPPTHAGTEPFPDLHGPFVGSIIDLERLLRPSSKSRTAADPFITFQIPGGCNFVSFAPSGLKLMTASENGDTQAIWGLMTAYTPPRSSHSSTSTMEKPTVTQLAKFTRFTPADIVDVAWSSPKEENLAVLTEKGTVHMFKLPSTVFVWPKPPPRRKSMSQLPPMTKETPQEPLPELTTTQLPMKPEGILGSAAAMVRKRSSLPGIPSILGGLGGINISAPSALREGRKVIEGVGRNASAAAEALRHPDEDRLRLSLPPGGAQMKSLAFLPDSRRHCIAVVSSTGIKIHELRFGNSATTPVKDRDLPIPSHNQDAPNSTTRLWPQHASGKRDVGPEELEQSVFPSAWAEIDSAPSYQPFFADRRFTAATYSPLPDAGAWAFGTDVVNEPVRAKSTQPAAEQREVLSGPQVTPMEAMPALVPMPSPSPVAVSTPAPIATPTPVVTPAQSQKSQRRDSPRRNSPRPTATKASVPAQAAIPATTAATTKAPARTSTPVSARNSTPVPARVATPVTAPASHSTQADLDPRDDLHNDGLDDEALMDHLARDDEDYSNWDVDTDDLLR